MAAPPEMERADRQGSPKFHTSHHHADDLAQILGFGQAATPLQLQAFLLARRCALSVAMAASLAPLIYGGPRT